MSRLMYTLVMEVGVLSSDDTLQFAVLMLIGVRRRTRGDEDLGAIGVYLNKPTHSKNNNKQYHATPSRYKQQSNNQRFQIPLQFHKTPKFH